MIAVHEGGALFERSKPLLCQKCGCGQIARMQAGSKVSLSRHGIPPPLVVRGGYLMLKCPNCCMQNLIRHGSLLLKCPRCTTQCPVIIE